VGVRREQVFFQILLNYFEGMISMREKEFRKLNGWIDYDRPHLSSLTYRQKTLYFRKRIQMVLLRPMASVYSEISISQKKSSLLIFATALCCAIEAMGKFYNGGSGKNRDRFESFVNDFMHPDFQSKTLNGTTYSRILWYKFRNGLAHGFSICHGGFEGSTRYFSIKITSVGQALYIDPTWFYRDFQNAIRTYLAKVTAATKGETIRTNFEKVFDEVFIHGR
jgi:hypothetical protein